MKHFNIRAAIASLFSGSGRNNRNGLPEKTDFSDKFFYNLLNSLK